MKLDPPSISSIGWVPTDAGPALLSYTTTSARTILSSVLLPFLSL